MAMREGYPEGAMVPVRAFAGAAAVREVYWRSVAVREHRHDWVTLTIPLAGGFDALSDIGEARIDGASAVLHPVGSAHAAAILSGGLEAIGIHLDPVWLRRAGLQARLDRTCYWTGEKQAPWPGNWRAAG